MYNPEIEIIHKKRQSFKNSAYSARYEFYKSLNYFFKKYYNDYKNYRITKFSVKILLRLFVYFLNIFNNGKYNRAIYE